MRRLVVASLLLLAVPALAATGGVPGPVAGIAYDMPKAPATGLTQITHPLTVVANVDPKGSWYWADEVEFIGDHTIASLGLQPAAGGSALFSVFGTGTTGTSAGCQGGSRSAAGTTCRIAYPWALGRTYDLAIRLQSTGALDSTWVGTVKDTASGATTLIGTVSVPLARKLVRPLLGLAQYYAAVPSCSAIPQMTARYGAPTGTVNGKTYAGGITRTYTSGSSGTGRLDCRSAAHASHAGTTAVVSTPPTQSTRRGSSTTPAPSAAPSASPTPLPTADVRTQLPTEQAVVPFQPSAEALPPAAPDHRGTRALDWVLPTLVALLLLAGALSPVVAPRVVRRRRARAAQRAAATPSAGTRPTGPGSAG